MVFEDYQSANNAQGRLLALISAGATSMLLDTGEGDLFPTHDGVTDKDYLLTLEERDTLQAVLKREIVRVTARVGDLFTIVRSAGYCPRQDGALTQTNTAFSFPAQSYVFMNNTSENDQDVKNEIERINAIELPSKLSIADYLSGDKLFADSTTGNDSYEWTLAGITSMAQIDGQMLRVRVDVANTSAATGELNSLGTYDIVKRGGDSLTTGDVTAGQIMVLLWNDTEARRELVETIDQRNQVTTEAIVDTDTYVLGQDTTPGQHLFKEVVPLFADSTSVRNIGDTTKNTRFAIPVFGSGVSASTLKLALKKFVSPSVDLGIRIETDNAGVPSGSLFHANGIATITAAGLTTSLVDTTATLAGSITIPRGEKVWIVLYAGTYGSETINGTNYFGIGYQGKNTTTRTFKIYDTSLTSANGYDANYWAAGVADDDNITFNATNASANSRGYRLQAVATLRLLTITKSSTCTATSALIKTAGGVLLDTVAFSGDVATLTNEIIFNTGDYFRIECYNAGASYTSHRYTSATFPQNRTNVNYINGSEGGSDAAGTVGYNINTITTELYTTVVNNFAYVTSSLFESYVLGLTDATYAYKLPCDIPRVCTETKLAGEDAICTTFGIDPNNTGLTINAYYYLTNTPGAIGTAAGTYRWRAGQSLTSTDLFLDSAASGQVRVIQTTRLMSGANGSVSVAHNLGRKPKYAEVVAMIQQTATQLTDGAAEEMSSRGYSDGQNNMCTYREYYDAGASSGVRGGNDSTNCVHIQYATSFGEEKQVATITFDETNVIFAWTRSTLSTDPASGFTIYMTIFAST